ncbi:acyl-CoA dehydrogenase, partial [Brevibacterium litoralis]|uniref:acyl-CoA dehydrogenase n=1 Tax=Brevibacterium litoralis TaxID=3138935 RepID=UPI0032EC9CD5
GTMCLSEAHAGSSLADLTTRAVPQDDGTHRIHGQKMWISEGEHELSENIDHLVLARTEGAPAGVKGLSLFIVPKYLVDADGAVGERNDVSLADLNHKMGYRGTTNTMLHFGEGHATPGGAPDAIGHLVGEEGKGLVYMFHMRNEARIGVGAGAAALGCTGHLHAARLLDLSTAAPDERTRREAAVLLNLLTPVVKSWPSTWCLVANDLAIQVHGGAGYTRDHDVEQFWRDNRLNPIHEGTAGIQAADLLGRKVRQHDGEGLRLLRAAVEDTLARTPDELRSWADSLAGRLDRLLDITTRLHESGDPAQVLSHAHCYLEATGHPVVAWLWLDQVLAATDPTSTVHRGKHAAARYFFTHELPTVDAHLDLLASGDRHLLEVDPAVL